MTRIAIAGASGYAGGEVARLVASHPHCEVGALAAGSNEGRLVGEVHPQLRSLANQRFVAATPETLLDHDVVVLALPHGMSGILGEQLSRAKPDLVIVDLGADRRLEDSSAWARYYGGEHFEPWVYGMPELVLADGTRQRERLRGATRIVAPGCNATAIILALAPLIQRDLIDPADIVATLAVGPSGAGRTLREDLLAAERLSSAAAYAAGGKHRHIPEVSQALRLTRALPPSALSLTLTPILVPMSRGILAVSTATLRPGVGDGEILAALGEAYSTESFVHVLPDGALPSSGSVLGSNSLAIGVAVDTEAGRVSVVSAVDNLVKGTAGAAIQCLNIALGLEETVGLSADGIAP